MDDAKAVWVGAASVLIPSTWVSFLSKAALAIRKEETWCVQPPVKEKMWNDRMTFFFPLKLLRVIGSPLWAGSVKSGAG
jgi:hypothetical protein